jgi:hypothetical protein
MQPRAVNHGEEHRADTRLAMDRVCVNSSGIVPDVAP